jgi:hypothetical protein
MKRHSGLALLLRLSLLLITTSVLLSVWASNAFTHFTVRTGAAAIRASIQSTPAAVFTVTNNGDSGAGSLRDAIDQANLAPGADLINFNPGLGTIDVGVVTGLPLPVISDAVTIDGGSPRVELNGTAAGAAHGLEITAGGVTVQGLVINRFALSGISLQSDSIVQGNFIGTNAAGTSALPNGGPGVLVLGLDNAIGGTAPTERNVISGNGGFGIELSTADDNEVEGNFIGTDATGTAPLGNAGGGVRAIGTSTFNTIGGTLPGAGNIIAFNTGSGVNIFGGDNNAILGNSIFANGAVGINLSDDPGVTPNDACDVDAGANSLRNFPVLTSVTTDGVNTTIVGSLNGEPDLDFRIEFFSSIACDPSGFGQGANFIGSTNIMTDALCAGTIGVVLPVACAPGEVITATATAIAEGLETSEFSQCVTVMAPGPCTITCPSDVFASSSSTDTSCGTVVTFSPAAPSLQHPRVPPSGSLFAVGTTTVTCTTTEGPNCSFNVTVVDETPPSLSCPAGITAPLPAGQSSAVVDYPAPTASDSCSVATIACAPPSGSTFPPGLTLITCEARDTFENVGRCFFFVTVLDAEPSAIRCPANVSVLPPAGQTSAVVSYPPPTLSDNLPGASIVCAPASGSSFPLGSTTVTCTATDRGGNKSSCSFIVGVGAPQVKVTIPGNKPSVEFTAAPTRKPPKPKNSPCSFYTIENIGFSPLVLTFDSLRRTGADVVNGRITDANDVNPVDVFPATKFFALSLVNSDESRTPIGPGSIVTIQPGQSQAFASDLLRLFRASWERRRDCGKRWLPIL